MRAIVLSTIVQGLDCELVNAAPGLALSTVVIDSRLAVEGSLFVACDGERVNGHEYVAEAFDRGAAAALVDSGYEQLDTIKACAAERGLALVLCKDPRRMLGDMAALYRQQLGCIIIGVTGSSGKTTTKSLIADLLRAKYKVSASPKNFNNDLGMPLCIFELDKDDAVAVIEMGMNHPGELTRLAEIARPDIAVITNIGDAHIGFFKDRREIARAKKEIFAFFTKDNTAILNRDDAFFSFLSEGLPGEIITFSSQHGFSVEENLGVQGYRLRFGDSTVLFPLGGEHNLYNVSAAVAVAQRLSLSESELAGAMNRVRKVDARTEVLSGRHTVINDTYNANPDSMRAAVKLLSGNGGLLRVAVIGDMFELGDVSEALHAALGTWIAESQACDILVCVGTAMQHCAAAAEGAGTGLRVVVFSSTDEAGAWLRSNLDQDAVILVKGSRGMRMERILPFLTYDV